MNFHFALPVGLPNVIQPNDHPVAAHCWIVRSAIASPARTDARNIRGFAAWINIEVRAGLAFRSARSTLRSPTAHGNLLPPPPNGFGAGVPELDAGIISVVITLSPSFNPSSTSVTMPSLIPVLI